MDFTTRFIWAVNCCDEGDPWSLQYKVVTDDCVWMLYWICYKQMMYDLNKRFL